jgi:uncharacterized protein
MERVIADTGFVVALVNRLDDRHADVAPIYAQYPKILLPQVVLVEVAYLINRDAGMATVIKFLPGLPHLDRAEWELPEGLPCRFTGL